MIMMSPLHRSRVRRRAPYGGSVRRSAIAASILLLLFPTSGWAYLGPTHCTKPGVTAAAVLRSPSSSSVGYSTFNHLLFDMVSIATAFESGRAVPEDRLTFQICRGAVIDLDDTSLPLGFLPIRVPRLTLQCGESGRRGSGPVDACVIRGGGKRDPSAPEWNAYPQKVYKNSAAGLLGGGGVAQIYVYGESAYEVTLRGLTFDNTVTEREAQMYADFVAQFGEEALGSGEEDFGVDGSRRRGEEETEEQYVASVPTEEAFSMKGSRGETSQLRDENWGGGNRNLQGEETEIKPAHRFASVAVRGKGYGDDAGPRLITIEDCKFASHRGYAVLVSPGIQEPEIPVAPKFEFPQPMPKPPPPLGRDDGDGNDSVNLQSSGQIYNGGKINNMDGTNNAIDATGPSAMMINGGENNNDAADATSPPSLTINAGGNGGRKLNLLENGGKYIPKDGFVSYYDHTAGKNYLDGRRVMIANTEFVDNVVAGENVAGLVTSAYSLTMTDCFFQSNDAKAMVFVYNNNAIVDNTIFAENAVEVSTVIMASPKGTEPIVAGNADLTGVEPTHIVERTCFLRSSVGMSNVLVTDVESTGFGQRDNYATGTQFTWVSTCEGGAAEQLGNDCLMTGRCDGTCVQFTNEKCAADSFHSRDYEKLFNSGDRNVKNTFSLGVTVVVAALLGVSVFC